MALSAAARWGGGGLCEVVVEGWAEGILMWRDDMAFIIALVSSVATVQQALRTCNPPVLNALEAMRMRLPR